MGTDLKAYRKGEFKAYRHEGCLIYTAKNKNFLEGFAKRLRTLSIQEKNGLRRKSITFGGVKYTVVELGKNKLMLVTGSRIKDGKQTKSDMVLVEE